MRYNPSDEALRVFSQSAPARKVMGAAAAKRIENKVTVRRTRKMYDALRRANTSVLGNAFYAANKMGLSPSIHDIAAIRNSAQNGNQRQQVLSWLLNQASYTPGDFGNFLTWGGMMQRYHNLFIERRLKPEDPDYFLILRETYARVVEDEQLKHYKALASTTKPALLSWVLCLNNIMAISFADTEIVIGEGLLPQRAHYTYNVIAPNSLRKFSDLLRSVAKSPEMLMFLNGETNTYTNPNENYARELLELHTFNVPAGTNTYGPAEVAFVARLLTGMRYVDVYGAGARDYQLAGLTQQQRQERYNRIGTYRFDMFNNRTNGPHQFTLGHGALARTWNYPRYEIWDADQAIDSFLNFVASHPQTAIGICTRIAKWYFGQTPPQNIVDDMIATYNRTDGDLAELYRTVVRWIVDTPMHGSKFKTGEELIGSVYRMGNVINPNGDVFTDTDLRNKLRAMKDMAIEMRHFLNNAPTVEGYFNTPERLISPTSMLARIDMLRNMAVNTLAPLFPDATVLYYETGMRDYLNMIRHPARLEIETMMNPERNTAVGDVITAMLLSPAILKR